MQKFRKAFKFLHRIFKYLCSLILLVLLLIPLSLLLPILFFRFFVSFFVVRWYPEIDKLIASRSAGFAADDLYRNPRCSVVTLLIVDGTVDIGQWQDIYMSRLVDQKDENGKLLKPEFKQYITDFWGFSAWKWEPNFDIRSHVRMYDGVHERYFEDSSRPKAFNQIEEVATELVKKPFEDQKSPWIIYVIHNITETGSPDKPNQSAILVHCHHSLGDGFSLLKAFTKDVTAEEAVQAELVNHVRIKSQKPIMRRIGSVLDFVLSAPYELLTEEMSDGINDWHVPKKQLQGIMNGSISSVLSMDYFKEIKAKHQVTFTALILECFTAAMRKFMMEAGAKVPNVIHCLAPLPVPGHPNTMTNHMTGCVHTLPVGLTDPIQRLTAIEANVNLIRTLSYPLALFYLQSLVGSIFSWMLRLTFRSVPTTAVMSNVPGPKNALQIGNNKIQTMSFIGSFHEDNFGMGFTAMSYNGTLRIAIGIDNGIVDRNKLSAVKLIDYFLEEAELLKNLPHVQVVF